MEKVFIFGTGGHAKVIIDIIEKQGIHRIAFLADDNLALSGTKVYGYEILGGRAELLKACKMLSISRSIVAIGDNAKRDEVASWLISNGFDLIQAVHPSAQVARNVGFGRGTVVMAGAIINSGTEIGENTIINTGATVDHDCIVGKAVHIAPGSTICGTVKIGDRTLIGAGATVTPGVTIGSNAVIGAGATVINDIADWVVAIGIPAKQVVAIGP